MADRLAGCWPSEPGHTAKSDLLGRSQDSLLSEKAANMWTCDTQSSDQRLCTLKCKWIFNMNTFYPGGLNVCVFNNASLSSRGGKSHPVVSRSIENDVNIKLNHFTKHILQNMYADAMFLYCRVKTTCGSLTQPAFSNSELTCPERLCKDTPTHSVKACKLPSSKIELKKPLG